MKAARRRREIFEITHARFTISCVKNALDTAVPGGFCEGKVLTRSQKPQKFLGAFGADSLLSSYCCPVVLLYPNLDAETPLVFKMANN